jgi:Lar family restriction alleviation protein
MDDTNEMKPCPFCGGNDIEIRERTSTTGVSSVSVMHWCEGGGKPALKPIERMARTREEAVRLWNRRA